jgi:hypothetical protein
MCRLRNERGRLVRAPLIDRHGQSFVVDDGSGSGLKVVRREALAAVACYDERAGKRACLNCAEGAGRMSRGQGTRPHHRSRRDCRDRRSRR